MKNNLKRITRTLSLFTILLLVSCSEDLYEHKSQKNASSYEIIDKSFEELTKDKKFLKAYSELNKNSTSKTIMEQNYNFTISDIPAKVIEKDGKASYTFHITRDTINAEYFENLVVGSDSLNQTSAYIAKYKVDHTKPTLINKVPFTKAYFHSIVYDDTFASKLTTCKTIVYSLCNGDEFDCGGSICGFGSITFCEGSGGGSDGGTWDGGVPTTPVTTIGGGGSNTESNSFYNGLSFGQKSWLDSQTDEVQQSIYSYLTTNGFTTTNNNKIMQLINVAIANNSTFVINNSNPLTNTLNFNSVSEFQNYLNTNTSNVQNIEFEDLVQNERLAKCDFSYGTFGVSVKIKQKMLPTYQVLNVTTTKTGLSILLSWTQNEYLVNINGSLVEIDIYGIASTGVNIGAGLNLTYDDQVHYHIVIDKNTGQIITANEIND